MTRWSLFLQTLSLFHHFLGLYSDHPIRSLDNAIMGSVCFWCTGYLAVSTADTPSKRNRRLDSKGTGVRVMPDTTSGTCSFEIVTRASDQSPGTVSRAKATRPYPNCGATTHTGYISQEAQGGRLGHQLYCIIYRDTWKTKTKSGRDSKRPKTARGFRVPISDDDNTAKVDTGLAKLAELWERDDILPTEEVPHGDDQRPHQYGMPRWREMFSPRQLLAHGFCVQAFHDLVDEDRDAGKLDENRKAAWCYVALAMDKLDSLVKSLCRSN